MAWKGSARVKAPRGARRDLWVGFKPYGVGETKPNHYKEIARTIWQNRRKSDRVDAEMPARLDRQLLQPIHHRGEQAQQDLSARSTPER